MTTTGTSVLEQIDALRSQNDPAETPLLRSMLAGELSRDEVRTFAGQYFQLVDALPRFVSTVHSVTIDHPTIRRSLLNMLVPMELNPPSIADLWLQTCAALGLFSDTVRRGQTNVATSVCLDDFQYLCQSGCAQGLAALYAWMSRLPSSTRAMQTALATHYDLTNGPGVQFFEVVGFQSESHCRALRGSLQALLDEFPEAGPSALDAADGAIRAVQGMYAGALSGSAVR
ncbi:MAG: coenzyme synthesis protein family protein [Thermoleophilia bacterium]|nr:coenzyme synthesis protein family protein [Thermoleophilia bacterium]